MNDDYAKDFIGSLFELKIKRIPICNSCDHQKPGFETMCKQYKRKPSSIKDEGCCEKYSKAKQRGDSD